MTLGRVVGRLIVAVAASAAVSRPAEAEAERALSLSVVRLEGAEQCAGAGDLAQSVEGRLGRPVFGAPQPGARAIEVIMRRDGPRHAALVRSYAPDGTLSGERSVLPQTAGCTALTEALSVVLSVMIDPTGALAAKPAEPPPPPAPVQQEPASPPPFPPIPPAADPAVRRLGALVRIDAHLLPVPVAAFGVSYEQGLPFGGFRLEGTATLVNTQQRAVTTEGVRMSVAIGSVAYCPLFLVHAPFAFTGCAGLDGGAWFVSSFGVSAPVHKTDPFLAGSARLGTVLALGGRLGISLGAGARALLLRPEYRFDIAGADATESVYRAPSIDVHADAGLTLRL
jgi:hypothetical protein